MTLQLPLLWTRRIWLRRHAVTAAAFVAPFPAWHIMLRRPRSFGTISNAQRTRVAAQAERVAIASWEAIALQAIDAARSAGAHYADVRLTRTVSHNFFMEQNITVLDEDTEMKGIGVRALVNGYWGFSASTEMAPDAIVRVARDAVTQAQENAKGPPRTVDFGEIPVARGRWVTPIRIDPFLVPLEEKLHFLTYWQECGIPFGLNPPVQGGNRMAFVRQERLVATSEGALFSQALYESAGRLGFEKQGHVVYAHGLDVAPKGWELPLDAKIPDQMPQLLREWEEVAHPTFPTKPVAVGRYTLVCDGATMASLVDATFGVATQLDRALGYEANAAGTSFLDNPLAMVGRVQVAAPLVTLTANRSAPGQLATVRWDDEGVVPTPFPLVKDGILVDFQTTREQAGWLAPYYHTHGQPVVSHGCAAAEDAHYITLQHMPNLSLEPSPSALRLEDLVADVADGILIEQGSVECDFQARTGLLNGRKREIKNGRLQSFLSGGAVRFTTQDIMKRVSAVGGAPTQQVQSWSQYDVLYGDSTPKGQPAQRTSHSVRAAAATLTNQPLVNPDRKA